MKNFYKDIDATPSKRIYLSIISDYDLKLGLCELIDNAIDSWIYRSKKGNLVVDITLDYQQQKIIVIDNSGGIPENEINLIISPGESRNEENSDTIGIFGVGSKRAVVALSQKISISSRYKNENTMLIEVDDEWINDPNWNIDVFKTNEINPNTTKIELNNLRDPISVEEEERLIEHLGATYSLFLINDNFQLNLNGKSIIPLSFESWSFPENYHPRKYKGKIKLEENKEVSFDITAGLTKKGDPARSEYGVYLYCNNRLVSKANKSYVFGYQNGKAGQPHPSKSLARIIVKLEGRSQLMPWNSSKSDINTKHPIFKEIAPHIIKIVTNYSKASMSMSEDWNKNVFQFKEGDIEKINIGSLSSSSNLYLVPIPRNKTIKFIDLIKKLNKKTSENKPWTKGSYESIIAVEEISKLKIEQKNRISLLVLDSALEIAFKDYLVNESGEKYSETRLTNIMKNRHEVHKEVKSKIKFRNGTWEKIIYFYNLRSELVHKRAVVNVSDSDLENFRELVEYVLKKMFKLNFS